MLNLKKGLALVLAAATAFTFAPVANLGASVDAEAATEYDKIAETSLTANGQYITYHINFSNGAAGTTYGISYDNSSLVSVYYTDKEPVQNGAASSVTDALNNSTVTGSVADSDIQWIPNNTYLTVVANNSNNAGDVHFNLYAPGKSTVYKAWTIHVTKKSTDAKFSLTATDTNNSGKVDTSTYTGSHKWTVKEETATDKADKTTVATVTVSDGDDPQGYTLSDATSDKDSVVEVINQTDGQKVAAGDGSSTHGSFNVKFVGVGTANISVQVKDSNGKSRNYTLTFDVKPAESTMKIGNTLIVNDTDYSDVVKKTITLTEKDSSADIGATLTDAIGKEKLTYTAYRVDKDGKLLDGVDTAHSKNSAVVKAADVVNNTHTDSGKSDQYEKFTASSDLTFSGDKVTATANALNAVEQYYDVLVTNNNVANKVAKAAWVRVVSIRNGKTFTNAEVTVAQPVKDVTAKAEAHYAENGDVADDTKTANITLSTKDWNNIKITALDKGSAMAASNISSSDSSVVEVSDGTLVAKKVGTSVITFSAKSDTTHYGNATVKLNVTVTDKYIAAKIDAADITLTNGKKTDQIKATSTPATKYHYTMGHLSGDTWVEETSPYVTLDKATGAVTFNGNGYGSVQVRITGDAVANVADSFVPKDITINYTNLKESALKVSTKTLSLKEGETGSIVASGASLGYVSSDENVATVDSTGKVTAVAPGTAVITVSDAGNDTVAADQEAVIVTVKANYKNPAKVTGVKVSNKKGAKVTVKYTKDTTNPNVKYYVQKKVSGKTAGKSVGSTKTTLSVKKGATVKVRVKAYYYDANGVKHVGAYSSWKTLKTDKK